MFEGCKEINDYIEEIFKLGLKEDYGRIINSNEIEGYYLSIPSRNVKNIPNLSQWERLFINIKNKSAKIYGEQDTENIFAECLSWAYEELSKILRGDNPNFDTSEGLKKLLDTKECEIVAYILTCISLKLKTYMGSKRNPNYKIKQVNGKRQYERIEFYYLDDYSITNRYDILEDVLIGNETGEMTEYLLELLKESDNLTRKQKQYLEVILSDDYYISASQVYDMNGRVVYNNNQYFFFNRQLAKELNRIIQEDDVIELKNGRLIFK